MQRLYKDFAITEFLEKVSALCCCCGIIEAVTSLKRFEQNFLPKNCYNTASGQSRKAALSFDILKRQ